MIITINEFKHYLENKEDKKYDLYKNDIDSLFSKLMDNFDSIITEINLHTNNYTLEELEQGEFNFDAIINDITIDFSFLGKESDSDNLEDAFQFELDIIYNNKKLVLFISFYMEWDEDDTEDVDEGGIVVDTINLSYYKIDYAEFIDDDTINIMYYYDIEKKPKEYIIINDEVKDKIEKLNTDFSLLLTSINFKIYNITN